MNSHKVLFVLTSHDQLGNTGKKTGFWIEEFAAPYYLLSDKGINVTIASPKGGQAPIDPKSAEPANQTEATKRYYQDEATQKKLSETLKLSTVKADDFDAIFYPGGHGPLWDLASDTDSINLIQNFLAQNKYVAAVCHGSIALAGAKDPSGQPIVKGKQVTGFTNDEEDGVQLTSVVPVLVEDKLKELGANYTKVENWKPYSVEDGLLITGQNPASSELVAEKILAKLGAK